MATLNTASPGSELGVPLLLSDQYEEDCRLRAIYTTMADPLGEHFFPAGKHMWTPFVFCCWYLGKWKTLIVFCLFFF